MRVPKPNNYKNDKKKIVKKIGKVNKIDMDWVILSDKDKVKFIKMVESIIRSSIEYKQYIQFLKDEIDMTQCTFFNNVFSKNGKKVSIEIHHEPFTLFDIVQIVLERYMKEDIPINPLTIAEDVMVEHYKNRVGLIPLCTTVHQLVHDGKIFIPLQYVFGNYIDFMRDNMEYISEDIDHMIKVKLDISKEMNSNDLSLLETKYVYLDVEGFTLPQIITK